MTARRVLPALLAVVVVVVGLVVLLVRPGSPAAAAPGASGPCAVLATDVPGAESALPVRPLCSLPAEAVRTWQLIRSDGPFPHDRDGVVFQNREKLLPGQRSGYYHEYTVPTPGEDDRGARRLVTGSAQELYWSDDHYASFVVVDTTAIGSP